jgi:muconolactone delta-isomerase
MKFMIIARFKDSFYALPPAKLNGITGAAVQLTEKLTKEGKLKQFYMLGNMKGVMAIYDFNSPDDLVRPAYENPMFPFMDVEITPLVEMDVAQKLLAKK